MNGIIGDIARLLEGMGETLEHVSWPERIVLRSGAISDAAGYIEEAAHQNILLVADEHTYAAAGVRLERELARRKLAVHTVRVLPNGWGDVVADEASVVQVLLEIQRTKAEVIVVTGGGTLHDIARYAAYTCAIPFISVPTAPSVDGFTSRGAPLIIRGDKITIPAVGPAAIFADIDVLVRAPAPMIAAGFGDILGKYTSLFDWKFGALCAEEPYSLLAAAVTERALQSCVTNVAEIGKGSEEGVTLLAKALIESGIAMLIFGASHPASGAEHHLSHYWEMEYLRRKQRQLLHGAKVGVACTIISDFYHRMTDTVLEDIARDNTEQIRSLIHNIPGSDELKTLLGEAGGPSTIEELGIEPELVDRGLRNAHDVRPNRSTLLNLYNHKILGGTRDA